MEKIKLVGVSFQNFNNEPKENDVVKIKLEKDNEFDKDAIAVFNQNNEKIGYVGTKNTVSQGNRKNGCIDNLELKALLNDNNTEECKGIINKFKSYFGFIMVDI